MYSWNKCGLKLFLFHEYRPMWLMIPSRSKQFSQNLFVPDLNNSTKEVLKKTSEWNFCQNYMQRIGVGLVTVLIAAIIGQSELLIIHTLRVHYAHAAANLNSGYSKYAKVARVHYFCTIALRTSRTALTRAWASRRVVLRKRRVDLFSKRVIIFCW